jgi:hypothetical protein
MIKFLSYVSWFDASKYAMNLAAMVDETIMVYFALLQEIAPPANIKI